MGSNEFRRPARDVSGLPFPTGLGVNVELIRSANGGIWHRNDRSCPHAIRLGRKTANRPETHRTAALPPGDYCDHAECFRPDLIPLHNGFTLMARVAALAETVESSDDPTELTAAAAQLAEMRAPFGWMTNAAWTRHTDSLRAAAWDRLSCLPEPVDRTRLAVEASAAHEVPADRFADTGAYFGTAVSANAVWRNHRHLGARPAADAARHQAAAQDVPPDVADRWLTRWESCVDRLAATFGDRWVVTDATVDGPVGALLSPADDVAAVLTDGVTVIPELAVTACEPSWRTDALSKAAADAAAVELRRLLAAGTTIADALALIARLPAAP